MQKLSADQEAHLLGRAQAFRSLGFSEEQVKVAFVQDGISPEEAESLVKEAWAGAVAGLIGRGGSLLARLGSRVAARGASKMMSPAAQGIGGRIGRFNASAMQRMGGLGQRAGRGLVGSARAFKANPMKALGGGALQAGQGMLFGGGKGLGGAIGKGIFGASTASMLMPGGQSPQIPQPYGQY